MTMGIAIGIHSSTPPEASPIKEMVCEGRLGACKVHSGLERGYLPAYCDCLEPLVGVVCNPQCPPVEIVGL